MTPEQHVRAKQIFLAACERSPELRAAFVEQECAGDTALRDHVEDLLLHYSASPNASPNTSTAGGAAPASTEAREPVADEPAASEPVASEYSPGAIVAKRYQIVSPLGRGGMGEVYLANDQLLQQRVALKFLPPELADDPIWVDRLVREVRAARRVTNSTVCRVFDIEVGVGSPAFISMEYVDGGSLASLLRRIGRPSVQKALEIARQLCIGLSAAHACGLIHRDLKPANIMIDARGAVRIMDFGLAAPRSQISDAEILAGTPSYMAPELFAGTDVSVRSDIYALGLVLYEIFGGRPAFEGQSFTELARQHQRTNPTPLLELNPHLDPAIERVVRQCLEKDPKRRPESALAVAAELPDTNPLAIAAAAGVTPTAHQVAGAGSHEALPKAASLGLFAGLAAGLGLVAWLGQGSNVWPEMRHARPPAVLLESARELCDKLDPSAQPRFEAYRLTYRASDEFLLSAGGASETEHGSAAIPDTEGRMRLATGEPVEYALWYRRAPHTLSPHNALNVTFGGGRASLSDPSRSISGGTTIVFDSSGRLVAFERIPTARSTDSSAPDWSVLLGAAGISSNEHETVGTALTAPWYADQTRTWQVRDESRAARQLRVEAGEYQGRPVSLAVLTDASAQSPLAQRLSAAWRTAFSSHSRVVLLIGALLGLIPLAWQNLRSRRGDPHGGARLALLVFCARFVSWALAAAPASTLIEQFVLLLFAILGALSESALVWIGYIAIEPRIRRHWPETIISWTRALSGDYRDPIVCRDILLGAAIGAACALLVILDRRIAGWIGLEALAPLRLFDTLDPLLGTRFALASGLGTLLMSLYVSLVVLALLVLGNAYLHRPAVAAVLTVIVAAPVYFAQVAHPATSWLPLLLLLAIFIGTAMRLGLLAVVCANFIARLLVTFPLTFAPGHWAFDASVGTLLVILGIAAYAIFAVRTQRAPTGAAVR